MLPKSAVISSFLAREYNQILTGSTLVKSEYHKLSKDFRFLFRGEENYHLSYSFAPPKFVLNAGWPEKSEAIAIWLEANDSRVELVSGPSDNRIVKVDLAQKTESGSQRRKRIIFELFGAQSTAFLVDENGMILQAARVSNDERALKPRKLYVSPEPLPQGIESGKEIIGSDGQVTYSLEYNKQNFRVLPSPATEALDLDHPLTALHAYLQRQSEKSVVFAQLKSRTLGVLNREIKRTQKALAKSESRMQSAEESERYKRWGDILMAGQNAEPDNGKVTLHDFYTDKEIEIPLPNGKGIIDAAQHYYKKAKKLQRSRQPLKQTLKKLQKIVSSLQSQHSQIAETENLEQLNELIDQFEIDLKRGQAAVSQAEEETSPYYRVFLSSTGAKILVGKSAEGNAHLTFRVARNYDLWFHAHQSPGSHVILMRIDKNHPPSPVAIEEAAQLAAAYSGQKKSQAVSVVFTERRYVRKVRRGAPGQVIPQNVKSLVVEPGIPPGVSEAN